jgi:hypothetical protein
VDSIGLAQDRDKWRTLVNDCIKCWEMIWVAAQLVASRVALSPI